MANLIRIKEVEAQSGLKKSMVYNLVSRGEFCPPVKISERSVAWISDEIEAINAARIAGQSNDQIRELVKTLMAKRKKLADEVLAAA